MAKPTSTGSRWSRLWLAAFIAVVAFGVVAALAGGAFADQVQADNDTSTPGLQNTITVSADPGTTVTTSAQMVVNYSGSKHLSAPQSVTFSKSSTTLPSGASVGDATVSIPSNWGTTTIAAATSGISFTAPTTPGSYSYTVAYAASSFSCASNPCLTGTPSFTIDLTVNQPTVTDNTGPSVELTSSPAAPDGQNGWFVSDPTLTVTATDTNDNVASIDCTVDGNPVSLTNTSGIGSSMTASGQYTFAADGDHNVSCTASDSNNNTGPAGTAEVKVDTAGPTASITSHPTNPSSDTSPSFGFSGSDTTSGVASFQCKIDSGSYAPCNSGDSFGLLSGGSHTFYVQAIDNAGNVGSADSYTWTVDTTPPTISFTVYEHGSTTVLATKDATTDWYNVASSGTGGIDLTVTASDASKAASLTCYDGTTKIIDLSGGTSTTLGNSSPVTLTDGDHNISCSATDGLGNSGASASSDGYDAGPPSTANAEYMVDQTAPSVSGAPTTSANGAGWYNGSVTIAWTCGDNTSGVVSCPVDSTISTEGRSETVNSGLVYDNAGNSNSANSSPAVNIDKTDPYAPTAAATTPSVYTDGSGHNWWEDTVTVSFSGNGDPALADLSLGSGVDPSTIPANQTFTTLGLHTASGTVSDYAGNGSAAGTLDVYVDNSKPVVTLTCPSSTLTLGSTVTANWSAADTGSGVASGYGSGSINIDTSAVGSHTAQVAAGASQDNVGHTSDASNTCNYSVVYNWTGFFQPVNNPTDPAPCNTVKAGSAIPVKFSLSGYQGMNILATGSPTWTIGTCTGTDDPITTTETVTAGGSTLNYDATSDQYIYVWKTDKTWAGKSMRLTVTLNDGTSHYARFTFTK